MSLLLTLNKGPEVASQRAVLLMIWDKGLEGKASKLVRANAGSGLECPCRKSGAEGLCP